MPGDVSRETPMPPCPFVRACDVAAVLIVRAVTCHVLLLLRTRSCAATSAYGSRMRSHSCPFCHWKRLWRRATSCNRIRANANRRRQLQRGAPGRHER